MKISIDPNKLEAAAKSAWADTSQIMGIEFTKAITDPIYPWPRGESPRDVVDRGQLRAAQRVIPVGDFATEFSWPVDHALPVHNGAVLRNGTILSPRRWTDKAFERRNPSEVFSKLMGAKL